jgi:broad specificity phosphatase PhoE
VEQRQPREMREFNAGELEGLMAEKMKDELNNQNKRRRQNLNMV